VSEFLQRPTASCTVVDTRDRLRFALRHIPGAVRLSWLSYRDGRGRTGKLPADLTRVRRELVVRGITADRPVVVVGDASGRGEDGRVAWMLRYLGYHDTRVLDGGWDGYRSLRRLQGAAGQGARSRAWDQSMPVAPAAALSGELRASIDDVQKAIEPGSDVLLLDTRSPAEWNGSGRYWPPRTGRIPGASHLWFRDLLDRRGCLDRSPGLMERLSRLGATPERAIITYCVAGVRSAHALVMLRALGFRNVRNYDGSWYEWSADRSRPIEHAPRETR